MNKKVCVFLSASDLQPVYEIPALELVELMTKNDLEFVYGGSERGLMKKCADRVRELGGKIHAVVSEEFRSVWRQDIDAQVVCPNIPDRKQKIVEYSDAFVILPGGTGTLDEMMEIIEVKKWGKHNKPMILLNTNGYWNDLLNQFEKMTKEGFLKDDISKLVFVTSDPKEAIKYLLQN